jgi:hypothetical protein
MDTDDLEKIATEIETILARDSITVAVGELLAQKERDHLQQAAGKMRRKVAHVAVVGSQGSGKSSLLNALLFTCRILPVGEGVTTSFVCFVEDAGVTEPRCEIVFKNGRSMIKPLDLASLSEFMDESQNADNERGVSSVACFARAALLTGNTSFADTPGLGTPISPHDERTKEFVRTDMSLGLFVLRTTPTLTESEAYFLNIMWASCQEFLFVQNVWGEPAAVVGASMRDNTVKLAQIAQKHGDSRPITLVPVNIHAALEGATNSRTGDRVRSGLDSLERLVRSKISRGGQWFEIVAQSVQIVACLQLATNAGRQKIAAASIRSDVEAESLLTKLTEAEESIRESAQRQRGYDQQFCTRCNDLFFNVQRRVGKEIEDSLSDFKHRIRRDGGYEGIGDEYLAKLTSLTSSVAEDFKKSFSEIARAFVDASRAEIDRIEDSVRLKVEEVAGGIGDVSGTEVVERVGSATGTVGGAALAALIGASTLTMASTIAAGGTALAGVAAGIAAVPGVGWVIAGAVLTAGWIVKAMAKEKRKESLLTDFTRVASTTDRELSRTLKEEGVRSRDVISAAVHQQFQAAAEQQVNLANAIRETISASEECKRVVEAETKKLVEALETAIADINLIIKFGENLPTIKQEAIYD